MENKATIRKELTEEEKNELKTRFKPFTDKIKAAQERMKQVKETNIPEYDTNLSYL